MLEKTKKYLKEHEVDIYTSLIVGAVFGIGSSIIFKRGYHSGFKKGFLNGAKSGITIGFAAGKELINAGFKTGYLIEVPSKFEELVKNLPPYLTVKDN